MIQKRISPLILILLVLVIVGPGTAEAHANIDHSIPAADSVLAEPPDEVTIWFTEPVEGEFSEIMVFAADGSQVDESDSRLLTDDPKAVVVSLVTEPPLAEGTYTVSWKNVSTVDGHIVRSSFVFSIGQAGGGQPTGGQGESAVEENTAPTSPLEPVIRWLILLSVAGIFGGLAFDLLVMRPALGRFTADIPTPHPKALSGRILNLIWLFMAFFLVGSIGQLLLQTNSVSGEGFPQLIGRPVIVLLTNTYWGGVWLWRMGLYLLLAAVLPLSSRLNPARKWGQSWERPREIGAAIVAAAMMLTLSLVSHAFATTEIRITAVISDYIHLFAASIWAGGLFHFAWNAPYLLKEIPAGARRPFLATLVPRFSVLAACSVAALILTGLFSSYAQVTAVSALNTPYGRILLVKIALIVPLLLLGAVNLFYLSRRLASQTQAGIQLGRTVRIEALMVLLVLLSVGFLLTMQPARQVASQAEAEAAPVDTRLRLADTAERLTATLVFDGTTTGEKLVTVELTNPANGQPIENASDVLLTITYPAEELSPLIGRPREVGPGLFEFDDVPFSLAGEWQAGLIVVRPTAFDARLAYAFKIGGEVETAVVEVNAIEPVAETASWLFGMMMVVLVLVVAGVVWWFFRRREGENNELGL